MRRFWSGGSLTKSYCHHLPHPPCRVPWRAARGEGATKGPGGLKSKDTSAFFPGLLGQPVLRGTGPGMGGSSEWKRVPGSRGAACDRPPSPPLPSFLSQEQCGRWQKARPSSKQPAWVSGPVGSLGWMVQT